MINKTKDHTYLAEHSMSERQVKIMLAGSLINAVRERIG